MKLSEKQKEIIEYVDRKHQSVVYKLDGTELIGNICDGKTYFDEGLEGYVCTKCHWNTSIK